MLDCPALYDLSRPLEVEVGCGKGRFLTRRAADHPDCEFLGIERMPERVRCFARKVARAKLDNARVLRLEALYTFHYLLPAHHARRVYVFFPDPWPKRRHQSHRLFGPLFLEALWHRLEEGGELQFATDHAAYFEAVEACFAEDAANRPAPRFARVPPMVRGEEAWTEFETLFRGQGLPIYAAAWKALPDPHARALAPLTIPPEDEPREGVDRRVSRGKEWREEQAARAQEEA
jgi:tRNA (guanine-N7-)-methyltransferase